MIDLSQVTDETVKSLIKIGADSVAYSVQLVNGIPVPFTVVNGKVTTHPELVFNDYAVRPNRLKAKVKVYDPPSFIEYFGLFADNASRIFADESQSSVSAVLDYHEDPAKPRWGQHSLTLVLRQSEEWTTWMAQNNKSLTQQQFAEFLEQNATDIVSPDPASMREIAEDLEATIEVDFASVQKQAGGKISLKYTETTKTTVSGGKAVTVPDQFLIQIPAFIGGGRVPMQVLLRYRVKEQKLSFFYTLIRPEEVRRNAFIGARDVIADALKIDIINGTPA